MKISLENQIRNNREAFERAIPTVGHFERFERKLENRERSRVRRSRLRIMASSIAAMFAIFMVFQFSRMTGIPSEETESVAEVAGYYSLQLHEEVTKIQNELEKLDAFNRRELVDDLRAIMKDSEGMKTEEGLMTSEEEISVIVRRYNAKIEALQHIYAIIKNMPDKNNNL